jgi:hypothetical protein
MDSSDEDDFLVLLLILHDSDKRGDKTGLTRCMAASDSAPEAGGVVAHHHDEDGTGSDLDGPTHAAAQAVLALRPAFGGLARDVQKAALDPESFRRRFRVTVAMFTWLADGVDSRRRVLPVSLRLCPSLFSLV